MTDLLLPDLLRHRAETTPDRPFLTVVGETPLTYAAVYRRSCAVATGLVAVGVRPGDPVLIMSPNSADTVCTWLGIALAGAIEVPINTGSRGRALEYLLENSSAGVLFIDEALLPRINELSQVSDLGTIIVLGGADPDQRGETSEAISRLSFEELTSHGVRTTWRSPTAGEIASVIYTSGTTGPAKGVLMPFGQIRTVAETVMNAVRLGAEDIFYCFHPMFHMAGKFMAVYGSMAAGGQVVLDTRFSPEAWLSTVRRYGATISLAHGPMVEMIHQQPVSSDDVDNPVTRIIASPLPARIAEDFERRFGLRGIETWGMTEINLPVWRPFDEPLRPGSSGRVLADLYDLRVVDPATDAEVSPGTPGEFVLRPHQPFTITQGYLRQAEATVSSWRNLWFHTGDLGYIDDEGYLYFLDRAKERIRRRGENISSYEIESCVREYPAVIDCAAVGVASEFDDDDDVKICVVGAEGHTIDPLDLTRYLVKRLPHFMVPRYVEFLADLPRTPTRKVRKDSLRGAGVSDMTWDRRAAGISLRELAAGK